MRYTTEQKEGLKRLHEKIKDAKVAMLCTIDHGRGSMHSRPMATLPLSENDDELWFFTYANSEKADEIRNKGEVNLSYADEGSGLYVSVSGNAEIIDDYDMVQKKWQPSLKKWFPQGNANPKVALIKVHVTECDYWDAGENRMIKLFHNIKAALTGHNGKQPDHEKIDFRKQ